MAENANPIKGYKHLVQSIDICGGRPRIRGTRMTTENVAAMVLSYGHIGLLEIWTYIKHEQMMECIEFEKRKNG